MLRYFVNRKSEMNRKNTVSSKNTHRIKERSFSKEAVLLIVSAAFYFLALWLKDRPYITERYYSDNVNKSVRTALSQFTGVVPFSVAEIFFYTNILLGFFAIIIFISRVFSGGAFLVLRKIIRYVLMLYIFFMILWGFNYSRISVAQMNGLESRLYSKTQLAELSSMLIQKANYQREMIKDEDLSKSAEKEYRVYIAAAQSGFVKLSEDIPQLGGIYGPPKPVISSPLMLYTGITGIYMPYTAEANVNISAPMLLFPSTLMHEMAHQRGIAPEDEANYIAYLASREMDDDIFRYSGTMLALIHSMNALNSDDPQLAKEIRTGYSKQVNEDIRYYSAFWKKYEGRANDAADRINDTYLKVNNESDGVKSYGRMVDLLLAHYYQKGGL